MEKISLETDPRTTDREMSFATKEEMKLAAAKKKASETICRAAANRSAGRLTDIGEYQTGRHYDSISKFLANFHERPSLLVPQIQKNLRALLKIELERAALECEFQKDLQLLKIESLQPNLEQIAERRREIVNGTDPTDEETQSETSKPHFTVDAGILVDYLRGIKGVPYFWRGVFNSSPFLSSLCSDQDLRVLEHLKDIRSKPLLMGGFKIEFRFGPNPFLVDEILSKSFEGTYNVERDRPYKFGGWLNDFISGRDVRWREGMDPTVRRSDSHTATPGNYKSRTKFTKTESFFNFFSKPENGSTIELLKADTQYAVGSYIHKKVVPYAILLLLGETDVTPESFDSNTTKKTPIWRSTQTTGKNMNVPTNNN
uniref:Nucleosome assembly protein 1-like 4 n=1 Tax=Lygus hesperus TaxID=30085 RepID=A0A0K8SXF2_LYGHE